MSEPMTIKLSEEAPADVAEPEVPVTEPVETPVEAPADAEPSAASEEPTEAQTEETAAATEEAPVEEPAPEVKPDKLARYRKDGKLDEDALADEHEKAEATANHFTRLINQSPKARLGFLEGLAETHELPAQWQPELERLRAQCAPKTPEPAAPSAPAAPAMTEEQFAAEYNRLMASSQEAQAAKLFEEYKIKPKIQALENEVKSLRDQREEETNRAKVETQQREVQKQREAYKQEVFALAEQFPDLVSKNASGKLVVHDQQWWDALEDMAGKQAVMDVSLKDLGELVLHKQGKLKSKSQTPAQKVTRPPLHGAPRPGQPVKPAPKGTIAITLGQG